MENRAKIYFRLYLACVIVHLITYAIASYQSWVAGGQFKTMWAIHLIIAATVLLRAPDRDSKSYVLPVLYLFGMGSMTIYKYVAADSNPINLVSSALPLLIAGSLFVAIPPLLAYRQASMETQRA